MRSVTVGTLLVIAALVVASACSSDDGAQGQVPYPHLDLRANGIGPYRIGDEADRVIDGLSASVGGADADSDDPETELRLDICGPDTSRIVTWGVLVLTFEERSGSPTFATWSYGFDPVRGDSFDARGLGLVTEAGVGLTTDRRGLQDAYGPRVAIDDDLSIDLSTFVIDRGRDEHLAGILGSTELAATVQYLERVPTCEGT